MDVGSIGGTDADSEEVNVYVCGASLIAPQVVLTAGHCVEEGIEVDSLLGGQVLLITMALITMLTVRCGEWDTQTEDEKYPFQERKVNSIVVGRQRQKMLIISLLTFDHLAETPGPGHRQPP